MRYTIKDLKEGRVALINEDHSFVEAVLRLAFPEDANIKDKKFDKYLDWKYLIKNKNNNGYTISNNTDLPIQKASEFMLSYAEETYVKGVKFKSPDDDYEIRKMKYWGGEKCFKWYANNKSNTIRSSNGVHTNNMLFCSNPAVYTDGKWAEIVEQPKEEPKKEIKKVDDPTLKVGDKVLGFKFEEAYSSAMDKYVGEVGIVQCIYNHEIYELSVELIFEDGNVWHYPNKYPNKYDEKELPKNWYCKVTEDNIDLARECQKLQRDCGINPNLKIGYFVLCKHLDSNIYVWISTTNPREYGGIKHQDYKEITTEQLRQIVNNVKQINTSENGKCDKVQDSIEQISNRDRQGAIRFQSRRSSTTVRGRHIEHKEISFKSKTKFVVG